MGRRHVDLALLHMFRIGNEKALSRYFSGETGYESAKAKAEKQRLDQDEVMEKLKGIVREEVLNVFKQRNRT